VSYTKEAPAEKPSGGGAQGAGQRGLPKRGPDFNLFAYLLAGMSAMFLLFVASNGMSDLHRELRNHTFERYHTLHESLLPFVSGKMVFTVVLLLASGAVLLGGGGLIFHIRWQHPLALVTLTFGYAGFAAGLMAVLAAVLTDERAANVLNTLVGMGLGLAGGCAFPPQQLPGFLREHVSPLLPTYWFAETVRTLEFGGGPAPWWLVAVRLAALSALLLGLAAFLFRRRFREGFHA
jgi:ABC-type multidrug transport system permease subunit